MADPVGLAHRLATLRRQAWDSVEALAALPPGSLLPTSGKVTACRRAVRAVIIEMQIEHWRMFRKRAHHHELCVVQDHFMMCKLRPPVQWRVAFMPLHIVACFIGVLGPAPLTVDMQCNLLYGQHVWRAEVCIRGERVWQCARLHEDNPVLLRACPAPVAMVVFACLRYAMTTNGNAVMTHVAHMPAELQAVDTFYDALLAAAGPADVWAAVARALPAGLCGAAVAPWRPVSQAVCAVAVYGHSPFSRGTLTSMACQLWVLLATGAKPGTLLRGLRASLCSVKQRCMLAGAVGLLAGGDAARPIWSPEHRYRNVDTADQCLTDLTAAWPMGQQLYPWCYQHKTVMHAREMTLRRARLGWCVA
jgi:hypothetical protein